MVWILQEFRARHHQLEILIELPMADEVSVETACQARMRDLYDRRVSFQGVRALTVEGAQLFCWTRADEQRLRGRRALDRLRKSAQLVLRSLGAGDRKATLAE
jgi:hypothetical protein